MKQLKMLYVEYLNFITSKDETYKGTNKNILIVTHMSIVNIILGLKNHFT